MWPNWSHLLKKFLMENFILCNGISQNLNTLFIWGHNNESVVMNLLPSYFIFNIHLWSSFFIFDIWTSSPFFYFPFEAFCMNFSLFDKFLNLRLKPLSCKLGTCLSRKDLEKTKFSITTFFLSLQFFASQFFYDISVYVSQAGLIIK